MIAVVAGFVMRSVQAPPRIASLDVSTIPVVVAVCLFLLQQLISAGNEPAALVVMVGVNA